MPHFGLMSTAESFNSGEGALLRARLHIRGGRRRLRQGKISSGIVTLYDALSFALMYYISIPRNVSKLIVKEDEDMKDDRTVFNVLVRANVIRSGFDYDAFDGLVDAATNEEMPAYDYKEMLASFETLMTELGVMPFDEDALPPEDPATP
ncbi:MAG: hypothetical protein HZB33_03890 [Nitrospirae bacterium]|nr:hypothetical protein [Nitrospirota bacterium]